MVDKKDSKKVGVWVGVAVVLLLLVVSYFVFFSGEDVEEPMVGDEGAPMVGDDEDEHGCIGSAGYTWCEAKGKCLREWEESCNDSSDVSGPDGAIVLPEAIITLNECEKMGGEVFDVNGDEAVDGVLVGKIDELLCDCYCSVKDSSVCKTFYDGCNTCSIGEEGYVVCTMMYCEILGEVECLEFV